MKYAYNPFNTHIEDIIEKMIPNGDFKPFEEWEKDFFEGREHMKEFYQRVHGKNYEGFLIGEWYAAARRKIEELG